MHLYSEHLKGSVLFGWCSLLMLLLLLLLLLLFMWPYSHTSGISFSPFLTFTRMLSYTALFVYLLCFTWCVAVVSWGPSPISQVHVRFLPGDQSGLEPVESLFQNINPEKCQGRSGLWGGGSSRKFTTIWWHNLRTNQIKWSDTDWTMLEDQQKSVQKGFLRGE